MPNDRVANGVRQFVDDDEAYLRWLDENPTGYVVNSERKPTSNYLILHQAGCRHINSPCKSNWTTKGYIKTCSLDVVALEDWAQSTTGGTLKPCGACKPLGRIHGTAVPFLARRCDHLYVCDHFTVTVSQFGLLDFRDSKNLLHTEMSLQLCQPRKH